MPEQPKVRTLLGYLQPDSIGIRTSLSGRLIFLAGASAFSLTLLSIRPVLFLPHVTSLMAYISAFCFLRAAAYLLSRPIFLLGVACIAIGVLNALLSPTWVTERVSFGVSRCFAFASLALATLLVALITRPSDAARFSLRIGFPWYVTVIVAVPFASLQRLAQQYRDILLAARSDITPPNPSLIQRFVNVSAALLSTTLSLASSLHCVIHTVFLEKRPRIASHRTLAAPLFAPADVLLISLLLPGIFVLVLC